MTTEDNGNISLLKPTSSSEDLSEYTDADESVSAPTEFLAEFLSAVMLKDYTTALKYCKLILHYEPNNGTAKEFYPLILTKLQHMNGNNDDGDNNTEDDDDDEESDSSSSSDDSSDSSSSDDSSDEQELPKQVKGVKKSPVPRQLRIQDERITKIGKPPNVNFKSEKNKRVEKPNEKSLLTKVNPKIVLQDRKRSVGVKRVRKEEVEVEPSADKRSKGSSDGTTGSYSSLEDDEAELDQLAALAAKYSVDNADFGNGNKLCGTVHLKSMFENKRSDSVNKTSHQVPFGTSSDSESPTEPVTQQTIAMLRARVVPTHN